MADEILPLVGMWYEHLDKGQEFKVVAVNDDTETIEVQHLDGDIEEFGFDEWEELEIVPTVEPEDWAGPYDNMKAEDMGYSDTGDDHLNWGSPLDRFQDED